MQVSGGGGEGGGEDGEGGILPGGLGRVLALAGTAASIVIGTGGEGTAEGLGITDVETQQRNFENVVQALGINPAQANDIVNTIDDDLNVGRAVAYRFATLAVQTRNQELIDNAPLIYRDIRARLRSHKRMLKKETQRLIMAELTLEQYKHLCYLLQQPCYSALACFLAAGVMRRHLTICPTACAL